MRGSGSVVAARRAGLVRAIASLDISAVDTAVRDAEKASESEARLSVDIKAGRAVSSLLVERKDRRAELRSANIERRRYRDRCSVLQGELASAIERCEAISRELAEERALNARSKDESSQHEATLALSIRQSKRSANETERELQTCRERAVGLERELNRERRRWEYVIGASVRRGTEGPVTHLDYEALLRRVDEAQRRCRAAEISMARSMTQARRRGQRSCDGSEGSNEVEACDCAAAKNIVAVEEERHRAVKQVVRLRRRVGELVGELRVCREERDALKLDRNRLARKGESLQLGMDEAKAASEKWISKTVHARTELARLAVQLESRAELAALKGAVAVAGLEGKLRAEMRRRDALREATLPPLSETNPLPTELFGTCQPTHQKKKRSVSPGVAKGATACEYASTALFL